MTTLLLPIFTSFFGAFRLVFRSSEFLKPGFLVISIWFIGLGIFYWMALSIRFDDCEKNALGTLLIGFTDVKTGPKSGLGLGINLFFRLSHQSYWVPRYIILFLSLLRISSLLGSTELLHLFLGLCSSQILSIRIVDSPGELPNPVLICPGTEICTLLFTRYCSRMLWNLWGFSGRNL